MGYSDFFKCITENSLGVVLAVIIAFFFYKVLMHILAHQSDITKMATEQNEHWQGIISEHSANAKAFHEEVKDAHKYQREEHKEMIASLGRINGFKE